MDDQEITNTPKKKKSRNLLGAVLILILLGGIGAAYWYFFMRGIVSTEDARFNGETVDIAPQIDGTITELYVQEGDQVQKGQVLFSLYKDSYEADLAKAKAELSQAEASQKIAQTEYEKAKHGTRSEEIDVMKVSKERLAMELKYAEIDYARIQSLYDQQLDSRKDLDEAESALERARYAFEETDQRLKLLIAGTRKEDLSLARENVNLAQKQKELAEMSVRQAETALGLTSITAPLDGVVVRCWLEQGDVTKVGTSVVTLFDPSTIHVDANIEEKYLDRVSIGDRVGIAIDAYPALALSGRVSTILPVANSQFSLIPSEGVSGAFIKVSQRIPIRVELDQVPNVVLGPGLSVEIKIYHGPSATMPAPLIQHAKS